MGFTLVALYAGINPIKVPKITNMTNAINTTAMDTESINKNGIISLAKKVVYGN